MIVVQEQWILSEQLQWSTESVMMGCSATPHLRIHIRLDNIWMMFTKVVTCLSVLSSTNNLDDVGAMIGCIELTCRVSQLVMVGVNQMGYSCKLRALGIGVFLVIGIWLVGL